MRRERDMNSHTAHSQFMGFGAVGTVSRVWTDRLLAWCHKSQTYSLFPLLPSCDRRTTLSPLAKSVTMEKSQHFLSAQPERPSCSNKSVSSYFGKGKWTVADVLQLISVIHHIAQWHHSLLGPFWERLVLVSVHLCWLSRNVNVTRCANLTSNMTGPTQRQFQRDRYNTILIGWRIRLHSKQLPLPTG